MGWGILGPGSVLDALMFPVPISKVCTSCRTNIHVKDVIGSSLHEQRDFIAQCMCMLDV